MDNYQVARFFNIDPDIVEYEWTNIDFVDRKEFMLLQNYIDYKSTETG